MFLICSDATVYLSDNDNVLHLETIDIYKEPEKNLASIRAYILPHGNFTVSKIKNKKLYSLLENNQVIATCKAKFIFLESRYKYQLELVDTYEEHETDLEYTLQIKKLEKL